MLYNVSCDCSHISLYWPKIKEIEKKSKKIDRRKRVVILV